MLLRGSVGKTAQFHKNEKYQTGFINAQMLIIRFIDSSFCKYMENYMISNFFRKEIADQKSGAVIQQIPAKKIEEIKTPIPPLAEQHRIVAKVDELMTLCDTLKAQLQTAQNTQQTLTDTIVQQAAR